MRFGLEIVTFGEFGEPQNVVRLAQAAETSGWEGLFVWDHLAFVWGFPMGDPWVILSAVAQATRNLRLGTMVTPIARRRPQVLAHTLATLDQLSGGRLTLGVGLGGVPEEFAAFDEPEDLKVRAAMVDEGLDILKRLWAGATVTHQGTYYTMNEVLLLPLPVQRPGIPIWIGGGSRPALRRAAEWDGWVYPSVNERCEVTMTPEELAKKVDFIQNLRTRTDPFDIIVNGCTEPGDHSVPEAYRIAGATWWMESIFGMRGSLDDMLARVFAGPPR
jgi:probable F420-dependent oxidoreductase